jgi:hypothetical protein
MGIQVPEPHYLLPQFNKLLSELLRGKLVRNTFQPWEIEILLDIEGCQLRDSNRREVLRRYQKAANKALEKGSDSLLMLSEYLERNRQAALARKTAHGEERVTGQEASTA